MKSVIMAGGEGTRLRPVTGEMPKPLVPFLGRPMLEHIILLLKNHGFDDICIAVKYRAEDIIHAFGDGERLGVHLQYRTESTPLGTAGGVKNCGDFCGNEDFLVISGDAACDFDLNKLMQAHKNANAAITVALYRNAQPLHYGLAVTDRDGFIRAFVEKPPWSGVVTDLVNTGIYVISPRAMEHVPAGQKFDFAKDLFPLLMNKGEKLLGVPMEGYWCDVGTPLSYYQSCVDALEGRLKLTPGEGFRVSSEDCADSDAPDGAVWFDCACRSRAQLMGTLSEAFLDLGADYSDGLILTGSRYTARISPLAASSAVRIAVRSEDAELAKELALSLKDIAEALDL